MINQLLKVSKTIIGNVNQLLKAFKAIMGKIICPWCLIITAFAAWGLYKPLYLHRVYFKSAKDILGFEVTVSIGLMAVLIALSTIKVSRKVLNQTKPNGRKYQIKAITLGFLTLITASISYILCSLIVGTVEDFYGYNNMALYLSSILFIYTVLVSSIAVLVMADLPES